MQVLEGMDLNEGVAGIMSPQPSKVWNPAHSYSHAHAHPHQHADGTNHSSEDSDDEGMMDYQMSV